MEQQALLERVPAGEYAKTAGKPASTQNNDSTAAFPLAATLEKLAIEPFTPQSVAAYKKSFPKMAVNPHAAPFVRKHAKGLQLVIAASMLAWVLSMATTGLAIIGLAISGIWSPALLEGIPFGIAAVCSVLAWFGILFFVGWMMSSVTPMLTVSWSRTSVECYPKEKLPDFALDRIVTIRRVMPEARFFVEEVTYLKDPFLIAAHGKEEYYVEVWDERAFERLHC